MRSRGFSYYFVRVVLGSVALVALAWTDRAIREAGHLRAVRELRMQWRLRPAPPIWSPPPSLIAALDDPATRQRTIARADLGPPTDEHRCILEYARTIPLPSRNGVEREIDVIRETWGMSSRHTWVLRENGIEVDSGYFAFFVCG